MKHEYGYVAKRIRSKGRLDCRNTAVTTVVVLAVMTVMIATVASATFPPAPFMVSGRVNYTNGTAVMNPSVTVTNTATTGDFPVRTSADSNLYITVNDSQHVGINDTIRINVTDGAAFNTTDHTVIPDDMDEGGFEQDMLLENVLSDLTVTAIETHGSVLANTNNCINATVANIGSVDAPEFNVSLSADGTVVDTVNVPGLNASDVTNISFTWTPQHGGTYELCVLADSDSTVVEANETNNELCKNVTVEEAKPDLIIREIALKTQGYVHEENIYGVEVANIGTENATGFSVSLAVANNSLGTKTITSLAAGASIELEYRWTPSVLGSYKLIAVADVNNEVDESNETNNTFTRTSVIIQRTDWHQFHYNEQHIGFSPSCMGTEPELLWSQDIGAIASTSVAVADGKVFAYSGPSGFGGGGATKLHCFDITTGTELWNVTLPDVEWGSWSSPAYHDGKVFTATGKETRCYNASSGELIWTFHNPTNEASCNGGPVIADGKVVTNDWQGKHYYCLDEETGELLWTFEETNTGSWGTAYAQGTPAYADGKFYLTTWVYPGGNIYCVNASTGEVIWHQTTPLDTCGSPTVANGVVYVTTYNFYGNGSLYALDASTGGILWQQTIQRTDSTPAVAYGNVYVAGGCSGYSDIQTYCFNATNGSLIWVTNASDGIGGWTNSVAVADGKVFVGKPGEWFDYAGIYALDAFTGDILWNASEGGSSPAVANRMLFTIGGGKLLAFYTPLPDLTVTAIETPVRLRADVINPIRARIENLGGTTAENFTVTLEADGIPVDSATVAYLAAGANTTVEFTWIPDGGNHTLNVTADATSAVTESNETNNSLTEAVTVLPKLTATVHVQIEGKNETIWSGTVTFSNSSIVADDGRTYYLNEPTALGALDKANMSGGFGYKVASYPWGLYVYEVAGESAAGWDGWMYRVDYVSPWVGASNFVLNVTTPPATPHRAVLWYYGSWTTQPLKIELSKSVVNVSENFTATVTAYNDTQASFEPVENATVHVANLTFQTGVGGNATISLADPGNYTVYADKGTWKDYTRSAKQIVTVLPPGPEESYGERVAARHRVILPWLALHAPDHRGALMLRRGWISIELNDTIRDCSEVDVWMMSPGWFTKPRFKVFVSSNGHDWAFIGAHRAKRGYRQYRFTGDFGDVRYIKVVRDRKPALILLDAVRAAR